VTPQGLAIGAAAGLGLLLVAARTRDSWAPAAGAAGPVGLDNGQAEQGQAGGFDVAAFMATFDPARLMPTDDTTAAANLAAFLATIRKAEGTAGPNGYRTLFGGALFGGYEDHPRRAARFTDGQGRKLWTTAAGAYQFMAVSALPDGSFTRVDTWDRLAEKLGLPDFAPESQDRAAVELIREAGALDDVRAGRFAQAVGKVRRIWASLPGAGYAQPEKTIEALRLAYADAGGTIAEG
jgi:lysozyme